MKLKHVALIIAVVAVVAVLAIPSLPDVFDDRPQLRLVTFLPDGPIGIGESITDRFYIQDPNMTGTQTMVGGPSINVKIAPPEGSGFATTNNTYPSNWFVTHGHGRALGAAGVWTITFTPVTEVAGYKNPDPVIKQVTVLA